MSITPLKGTQTNAPRLENEHPNDGGVLKSLIDQRDLARVELDNVKVELVATDARVEALERELTEAAIRHEAEVTRLRQERDHFLSRVIALTEHHLAIKHLTDRADLAVHSVLRVARGQDDGAAEVARKFAPERLPPNGL